MLNQPLLKFQINIQELNTKRHSQNLRPSLTFDVVEPIVGSPKAEAKVKVEVTPKPLQLQVLEEILKFKRVTCSSTKKETPSKEKGIITIDLDPTKMKMSSE